MFGLLFITFTLDGYCDGPGNCCRVRFQGAPTQQYGGVQLQSNFAVRLNGYLCIKRHTNPAANCSKYTQKRTPGPSTVQEYDEKQPNSGFGHMEVHPCDF